METTTEDSPTPESVIHDLLTLDVKSAGPDWIRTARILSDAVDLIERLTPRRMTRADALAVLREHRYRGTERWGDSSVGVTKWAEWELFAAVEKLIRDGGPVSS